MVTEQERGAQVVFAQEQRNTAVPVGAVIPGVPAALVPMLVITSRSNGLEDNPCSHRTL